MPLEVSCELTSCLGSHMHQLSEVICVEALRPCPQCKCNICSCLPASESRSPPPARVLDDHERYSFRMLCENSEHAGVICDPRRSQPIQTHVPVICFLVPCWPCTSCFSRAPGDLCTLSFIWAAASAVPLGSSLRLLNGASSFIRESACVCFLRSRQRRLHAAVNAAQDKDYGHVVRGSLAPRGLAPLH